MRKAILALTAALAMAAVPATGQPANPHLYRLDLHSVSTDTENKNGAEVRMVTVKFSITREGDGGEEDVSKQYKILIEEDGREVARRDVPRPERSEDLSVILAVDTSGSMAEHRRMEKARDAAKVFFQNLPKQADAGLVLFDHEVRHSVKPGANRAQLEELVQRTPPRGGTAYLDATRKAIAMLAEVPTGRQKAVVLMTDGVDINSDSSPEQVIAEAREKKTRVYTVGIGEPGKQEKVTSVLALDRSGSMQLPADDQDKVAKIDALKTAAVRFVNTVRETNPAVVRSAVLEFSDVPVVPDAFSNNKLTLRKGIADLKARGETALFDATYAALGLLEADRATGKRVVVALTDGIDNSSRRRVDEVIARAKEAKINLFMLGFGRPGELDEKVMRRMAEETGGKYYHAKNEKSLLAIFENLSIQLHDDGIDELSLRKLAHETGGQYYPAKDVSQLQFILQKVTQSIQQEQYTVSFPSLRQRDDGTGRGVTLKLVRLSGEVAGSSGGEGGNFEVVQASQSSYQVHGVVVPEMNHFVYLGLLGLLGALLALPAGLRRLKGSGT